MRVDNAVHNLIEELTGTKRDWDIHIISDVRNALCETLEFHGIFKAAELYPSMPEADADSESERASFSGAVADFRSQPLKIILEFIVLVFVLLSIFYGLQLCFGD